MRTRFDSEGSLLNGTFTSYHKNGAMRKTVEYKDGLKNGRCARWNSRSILIYDFIYKDGIEMYGSEYNNRGNLLRRVFNDPESFSRIEYMDEDNPYYDEYEDYSGYSTDSYGRRFRFICF